MQIYIAGSSREIPRAKYAMNLAINSGFMITLDWVSMIESFGRDGMDHRNKEQRAADAFADIDAVINADVVWFLIPSTESKGLWCELGAALAYSRMSRLNIPVLPKYLIGSWETPGHVKQTPFFAETLDMIHESDSSALKVLRGIVTDPDVLLL